MTTAPQSLNTPYVLTKEDLVKFTSRQLDSLYLHVMGRLAYHISTEGYIHYLTNAVVPKEAPIEVIDNKGKRTGETFTINSII